MQSFLTTILSILKGFKKKGSFVQNFSIVFSGKSFIFLVGFLLTPVIARVYSPEAYGTFALYNSIVMSLSIIVGMKIPASFVTIHSERKFRMVLSSLLGFISFNVIILSAIFYFFDDWIFFHIENKELIGKWYLISAGVFLHNLTGILGNWNVRDGAFAKSSVVSITESLSTKFGSLALGLLSNGMNIGLILGEFIGKSFHIGFQIFLFVKNRIFYFEPSFSLRQFRVVIKNFKEYPLFLLPSALIAQISDSVVIIYLSSRHTSEQVGIYSMSIGLIAIPIMLISYSSQPVLIQKVVQLTKNHVSVARPVAQFLKILLIISLPVLILGIVFGREAVEIFLGENWIESALILSWMVPIIGVQFLLVSISGVFIALKKNKEMLLINSARLVSIFLILIIATSFTSAFIGLIKAVILGNFVTIFTIILLAIRNIGIRREIQLSLLLWLYAMTTITCYWVIGFFNI